MKRFLLVLFTIIFLFNIYISIYSALNTNEPDFAATYYAASVILDSSQPNNAMYDLNTMNNIYHKYGIDKPVNYIYSMAVAYLFVPFALLPYQTAKVVFNIFSLITYIASVFFILRLEKVNDENYLEFLSLSLLCFPFLINQYFIQSNAIILFFISLATLAASKNRPYHSGVLIGVASLFKIYPIAIALIFGLKNWRILGVFASIFFFSMLIPGSFDWFHGIYNIFPRYSCIYIMLNEYGIYWYYIYAAIIVCITAFVAYHAKSISYLQLSALTIPAVFLVMPLIQYHHLTVLVLSFAYLFSALKKMPRWLITLTILTYFMINYYINYSLLLISAIGLLLLWLILIIWIYKTDKQVQQV